MTTKQLIDLLDRAAAIIGDYRSEEDRFLPPHPIEREIEQAIKELSRPSCAPGRGKR